MSDGARGALAVAVDTGPIERTAADVAVVTVFESDRPLRGEAGRVDWRLCGMLSQLLARGTFRGGAGEAVLLPTFGRLRAPRVLVLGLGSAAGFGALEAKAIARSAVERLVSLRVRTAALALPGHWTGLLPVGPSAAAVLRGASTALEDLRAGLRLRLVVPEGSAARALGGLETAVRQLGDGGVLVRVAGVEPLTSLGGREAQGPGLRDDRPAAPAAHR